MNTNYENLANAIILQAVDDYREVLLWLNAHKKPRKMRQRIKTDRQKERNKRQAR